MKAALDIGASLDEAVAVMMPIVGVRQAAPAEAPMVEPKLLATGIDTCVLWSSGLAGSRIRAAMLSLHSGALHLLPLRPAGGSPKNPRAQTAAGEGHVVDGGADDTATGA